MSRSHREDRRTFLRGLQGLLVGGAACTMLPQMELVGRALAAGPAPGDYRALVCIFLFGGNDSFNMLIPHVQAEYDMYLASRGGVYDGSSNPLGLGIARSSLEVIDDVSAKNWGLHPACAALKPLFQSGNLAFLANVGTLVEPMTKQQFVTRAKPIPPYLYSHNDQQRQWMRGHSTTGTRSVFGWGGLSGDRLKAMNPGLQSLPPTISIAGNNLYQSGESVLPFAVSSGGPRALNHFRTQGNRADRIRMEALRALLQKDYTPIMQEQYGVLGESSIVVSDTLRTALDPDNGGDIATVFPPNNNLASQLRMIARLIKVSQTPAIDHKRQIFFASMGGFDTHENQMQDSVHSALLTQLSEALSAFNTALQEVGAQDKTVSFTMSDFGRTLNSNGNGTDHAWGGVQMMMGGSSTTGGPLLGRRVWGDYPILELDGDQSVERGRMLPTTSLQQMGSTLATWMGVESDNLQTIFPGVDNFSPESLGFLA